MTLVGGIDARCEDLMGELKLNGMIAVATIALEFSRVLCKALWVVDFAVV
jgi:hypothetical protein